MSKLEKITFRPEGEETVEFMYWNRPGSEDTITSW